MKESFSALGRFLTILVVATIAIAGVSFLLRAVPLWSGGIQQNAAVIVTLMVESLRDTWFVVGAVGVLAWQFGQLRRSNHHWFTRLLVFLVSSTAFLAGGAAIGIVIESLPDEPLYGYELAEDSYYNTGQGFIYIATREGLTYPAGLRVDPTSLPRFTTFEAARQIPRGEGLVVPSTEERLGFTTFRHVYWNTTAPPSGFAGFFSSVRRISAGWIAEAAPTNLLYIGFGVLVMMMWNTAWSVVRLTRWPLFNGILTVLLVWGVTGLLSVESGAFIRDILGGIVSEEILRLLPHATLLFLTLVFTVINIFEPPFRQWQRNVSGG